MMKVFFVLLSLALAFTKTAAKDTYRAAVLEHSPILDKHSYEDLLKTIEVYLDHMKVAAKEKVDIIVFPEDGLTASVNSEETLWASGTKVPDPKQRIAPCDDQSGTYSNFLVKFSCAARLHQIYAVLNLVETVESRNGSRPILYNTNVVFDRRGAVIASHRKINLYEENYYQPGPHKTATFTTDFNVTFGMFTCFDIFYPSPAEDVLKNKNVTDIVFSTSWYQGLPFLIGNSIQHSYAVLYGVNFLASGLNHLDVSMGGSGIYSANGNVISAFISGNKDSKLLIANVPKVKPRPDYSNSCRKGERTANSSLTPDVHLRKFIPPRLENYTLLPIDLNQTNVHKTICGSTQFCCTFNVAFKRTTVEPPNYFYRLLVYDGVNQMDKRTIGFAQCAVVACTNSSASSCGGKLEEPPTGIHFKKLWLSGSFVNADSRYMPLTVSHDLLPIENYVYCRKSNRTKLETLPKRQQTAWQSCLSIILFTIVLVIYLELYQFVKSTLTSHAQKNQIRLDESI